MNYFELYHLPMRFLIDEQLVRSTYLRLSKKYHPDFHTQSAPEEQAEILRLSTENNKAFQVLSSFDRRMKYILKEKGFLEEEEKYTLPQMFLMEMMDLNELLMEIQFDPDPEKKEEVLQHVTEAEASLYADIEPLLLGFDESGPKEDYLAVKEYYYKRRYLLRIREQLDKFAAP